MMLTIILLGIRLDNQRAVQEMELRCRRAAEIYRSSPHARIIACGGAQPGEREAEAAVMGRRLTKLGVDKADLFLEDRSRTTMENIVHASALLSRENGDVVIVTSDYHVPRVRLIAKRRGLRARVRGADIPFSSHKLRRIAMEVPCAVDMLLGFQDPGARRPGWTRLIMKLLRQEKP